MNDGLSDKAEDIFFCALEIESLEQRRKLLDQECQGDAVLRSLVEDLLASQADADRFFAEPRLPMGELAQLILEQSHSMGNASALDQQNESIGKTVGVYKLLQKIGEGGCGVVYMAEQEKPVHRRVALKIIKLGMDTKSVIGRFEAERQALAMMDHPNIARVLDAGATETGRPYFVMELVRGVKITEYCDQNQLNTRQRMKLFIQVCHAIQHAHQKGVIHRDVKPSNILVTIIDGEPVPKVIDFGIAKAIEGPLSDNTVFTAYEQFVGTPAYMSPEQAGMNGVDVDTRSDVYSLGVLLYELLTGRTPFDTKALLAGGVDGLRHMLREHEPKWPSALVTTLQGSALSDVARSRGAEPPKLVATLRGDLDWIVIRALEKERARRYQTANGLAMDVQRYLNNEPVLARPPSRFYLLQKLVRRNKIVFIAGATVTFALVFGLGLATWFWHQEREAHKLADLAEQGQRRLRLEAEDRERIAEANFLLLQGDFDKADALVEKVSVVKPSLETESVLRALGQWHALKSHWLQSAERFNLLLDADQRDNSMAITTDLLMAGPIQIERGDLQGYNRFRRAAVARFLNTTDPVSAERTLKICLLLPPDAQLMKSLEVLSDRSSDSVQGQRVPSDGMVAWRCISLALMAYRQNYTPTAKAWCQMCLSYQPENAPVNQCRNATAHIIQAMASYKLGETELARKELMIGHSLVEARFSKELDEGNGSEGFWYDWLFTRILLREAETLLSKPIPADG